MESTDVRDCATPECSALRRDPTTAPGSGDRVPYVIVSGSKGAKAVQTSKCIWGPRASAVVTAMF